MRIDRLVFGPGDRVTGWGCIRESGDGVWFDRPPPVPLNFSGRPWPLSPDAVRLEDADLGAVATAFAADGSLPGWATVTGVWLGDRVRVEEQSPVPPPSWRRSAQGPSWTRPPCPPPGGGWPTGGSGARTNNLEFDLGDLSSTGAVVTAVTFRPGPDQRVLVVAATDEGAAERRLRPQLGAQLCIVPSRWTRAQLDATYAVLGDHRDWTVGRLTRSVGEDGQAHVDAAVLRVLPEMADWAMTLPDDLLRIDVALVPARGLERSAPALRLTPQAEQR